MSQKMSQGLTWVDSTQLPTLLPGPLRHREQSGGGEADPEDAAPRRRQQPKCVEWVRYSLGHQVVKKVLLNVFCTFALLAWAAQQLQYSPTSCGTLWKHFTKPFSQPDAPDCRYSFEILVAIDFEWGQNIIMFVYHLLFSNGFSLRKWFGSDPCCRLTFNLLKRVNKPKRHSHIWGRVG